MVDSPGVALFSSALTLENDAPSAKKKRMEFTTFYFRKISKKILPGALDEGAGSDFFFSTFLFLGDDPAY